jgi:uncharacterized membrane protein (DUF485 family)
MRSVWELVLYLEMLKDWLSDWQTVRVTGPSLELGWVLGTGQLLASQWATVLA